MIEFDLDESLPDDPARSDRRSVGPRPPLGRATRRRITVAIVLVLAAVIAVGLDDRGRRSDFAALLERIEQSHASVRYAENRVRATVAYASPQLLSASAPAEVRADLRDLVQASAREQVPGLRARRAALAEVEVARWHPELHQAKQAYLEFLDQRITRLEASGASLRALFQPDPERVRLLDQAVTSLAEAAPDPAEARRAEQTLT